MLKVGRNKFCFTGGIVEASVQLPGTYNVVGMWPAVWTMGNLGRAGYGASLEGMVSFHPPSMRSGTHRRTSGHTRTILVMLVQHPTRRTMDSRWQPQ